MNTDNENLKKIPGMIECAEICTMIWNELPTNEKAQRINVLLTKIFEIEDNPDVERQGNMFLTARGYIQKASSEWQTLIDQHS